MASHVSTDDTDPLFVEAVDAESLLARAAAPVLETLEAELANEPVCLILTDAHGVVLRRSGCEHSLLRALDSVHLAPGFRYSESDVGTNGIGTALEIGGPIQIDGADHFTGNLQPFSCAGALITHPVSGALLGVIDLTTKANYSNPLLLSFAKLAARRIQERIMEEANALNNALLGSYYAACRHSGGPVLAIGKDVFMMNALAQQRFDASDQAALIAHSKEAIDRSEACTLLTDLPSGQAARLAYQPTFVGDALAGGVIRVKPHDVARPRGSNHHGPLAGLAGSSPAWRRVSNEVLAAATRGSWVTLHGEVGVGKLALVTAAHDATRHDVRLAVADASDKSIDLIEQVSTELEDGADLVIRHADRLDTDQLVELIPLLEGVDTAGLGKPWVVLTTRKADSEVGAHLMHFFPRTISVPPLRHHIEDVPELVRTLLNRVGATDLSLAQSALNQLMRLPWHDNVSQLRASLLTVFRAQRSGVVDAHDLPAECQATTRRNLTRLEALERDAVIEALKVHGGDKAAASKSLGISRATIYRRIREYGIVS